MRDARTLAAQGHATRRRLAETPTFGRGGARRAARAHRRGASPCPPEVCRPRRSAMTAWPVSPRAADFLAVAGGERADGWCVCGLAAKAFEASVLISSGCLADCAAAPFVFCTAPSSQRLLSEEGWTQGMPARWPPEVPATVWGPLRSSDKVGRPESGLAAVGTSARCVRAFGFEVRGPSNLGIDVPGGRATTLRLRSGVSRVSAAPRPHPRHMDQRLRCLPQPVPSIEKKYARPVPEWKDLIRSSPLTKHRELVSGLRSEPGLAHGHANAFVAHTLQEDAGPAWAARGRSRMELSSSAMSRLVRPGLT